MFCKTLGWIYLVCGPSSEQPGTGMWEPGPVTSRAGCVAGASLQCPQSGPLAPPAHNAYLLSWFTGGGHRPSWGQGRLTNLPQPPAVCKLGLAGFKLILGSFAEFSGPSCATMGRVPLGKTCPVKCLVWGTGEGAIREGLGCVSTTQYIPPSQQQEWPPCLGLVLPHYEMNSNHRTRLSTKKISVPKES